MAQVMKNLRSSGAGATAGLSKSEILNAMKAKLTLSDNDNKDGVMKNF